MGLQGPKSPTPPPPSPFIAPRDSNLYISCAGTGWCWWMLQLPIPPPPPSPPPASPSHPPSSWPDHPIIAAADWCRWTLCDHWLGMSFPPEPTRIPQNPIKAPPYLHKPCAVTDWCRWMLRVLWLGMHTGPTRPALRSRRAGRAGLGSSRRLRTTCAPPKKPSTGGGASKLCEGRGKGGGESWGCRARQMSANLFNVTCFR